MSCVCVVNILYLHVHMCVYTLKTYIAQMFIQLIRLLLRWKCILLSQCKCWVTSLKSNWTNVSLCFMWKYCREDYYFVHLADSSQLSWGLSSQGLCCRLWPRLIGKTGQFLHGACLLHISLAPHFCGSCNAHSSFKKKKNCIFILIQEMHAVFLFYCSVMPFPLHLLIKLIFQYYFM